MVICQKLTIDKMSPFSCQPVVCRKTTILPASNVEPSSSLQYENITTATDDNCVIRIENEVYRFQTIGTKMQHLITFGQFEMVPSFSIILRVTKIGRL